jgi:hypothetical protein
MEPLSIIATLCGVITALHAMYQWWHHFFAKTKEKATENALQNAFMRIWNKYNRIASVMGKNFQLSFNGKVLHANLKGC